MKRFLILGALALGMLSPNAQAQAPYNPASRSPTSAYIPPPVISPYLNLLNSSNPAVNYYLQVQPEFQRRINTANLEGQIRALEQQPSTGAGTEVAELLRALRIADPLQGTGHPVTFNNLTPYYNVRGTTGRPLTGAGQALPPAR